MPHMRENIDGEVLSGVLSALIVSPFVAVVDKAVFSSASGKMSYSKSFRECGMMLLVSPMVFIRRTTFKWCFAVYAATYVTANCSDRFARLNGLNPYTIPFLATSAVAMSLSISKDKYLTKKFSVGIKRPLSRGTVICYAIRDLMTIVSAFTLVEPAALLLQEHVYFYVVARLISQSCCPILAQLLNTPFFIYGMDLYNRPNAKMMDRFRLVKNKYWETYYWARVARVGPAYSVGGILNWFFRHCLTTPIPTEEESSKEEEAIQQEKQRMGSIW